MTRLKAIIESTPELIGGKAATPVVETATQVAARRSGAINQAKADIARVIEDLERGLGYRGAFPAIKFLSEAFDALSKREREK